MLHCLVPFSSSFHCLPATIALVSRSHLPAWTRRFTANVYSNLSVIPSIANLVISTASSSSLRHSKLSLNHAESTKEERQTRLWSVSSCPLYRKARGANFPDCNLRMIEHEALAGQQQAQQQRQIEERARQAQLDRDRAKQLKANRQQHQQAGGSADVKGKKRARDDDDRPEDGIERAAKHESVITRQGPSVQPFKKGERVLLVGEGEFEVRPRESIPPTGADMETLDR